MRLRGKIKHEGFSHPFYKLDVPPIVPQEEVVNLISEIRAGNKEAADRVVMCHIRLMLSIVGRYLTVHKDSDSLTSAAVHGLCYAVNKIKEGSMDHDNLTGYLVEYIHRFLSEHLDRVSVVRVPRTTKQDHGGKIRHPVIEELTEAVIEQHFDKKSKVISKIELDEILDKIVQSPLERQIIEMRTENYKDDEIAIYVGLSKTSVFLIRRELEHRFVSFFGD